MFVEDSSGVGLGTGVADKTREDPVTVGDGKGSLFRTSVGFLEIEGAITAAAVAVGEIALVVRPEELGTTVNALICLLKETGAEAVVAKILAALEDDGCIAGGQTGKLVYLFSSDSV